MNPAFLVSFMSFALATVALLATRQQHKLAVESFQLGLFNKRFSVYKATKRFAFTILESTSTFESELLKFHGDTETAKFLFEKDILIFLKKVKSNACDVKVADANIEEVPAGENKKSLEKIKFDLLRKLNKEADLLEDKFSPYLKLRNWHN